MKAGFYQYCPVFGKTEENLRRVLSAVRDTDADLLVLPEFFATGYQFVSREEVAGLSEKIPDGQTTQALSALSQKKNLHIVAGLPEKAGEQFYNSAVLTGPDGFIGVYRKTHLFFEEKLFFSPGDTGFQVWDTVIGRIGIMICFDWYFPESMRTLALMGADVVAHPSNLVLPHCPNSMPVLCRENRVYAVTANRIGQETRKEGPPLRFIGQSQITAPDGTILVRALADNEALLTLDIDPAVARNKAVTSLNNLFEDRRPEMYRIISENRILR
ncbi:MAG: nitrilase-related carbon-nitrogen hydrolase [Thermodesulfovibrionales bacterium]|nr:nitrilase-related carbon-nitrogen hydrolase [Thermodesulfovibrionales bacterium]